MLSISSKPAEEGRGTVLITMTDLLGLAIFVSRKDITLEQRESACCDLSDIQAG